VCETRRSQRQFVVTVSGDLDLVAVAQPDFQGVLALYRTEEPLDILIELGDVRFLDSVGVSWLVSLRSAATLADRRVRVWRPSLIVEKVLHAAGLRRYFPDATEAAGP
jgi:anti-anti-sigma factor